MRGRPLCVHWRHTTDELAAQLKGECDARRRLRLRALMMIREGERLQTVGNALGVHVRTLQRWLDWYRHEGLDPVLKRTPGHGAPGRPSKLTSAQIQELLDRLETGEINSTRDAIDWVADHYGVDYAYSGMHGMLRRARTGSIKRHQVDPLSA